MDSSEKLRFYELAKRLAALEVKFAELGTELYEARRLSLRPCDHPGDVDRDESRDR